MAADPDAIVRAELWDLLRWKRYGLQCGLDDAEQAADDIARYARSCTPVDLRALDQLRRLAVADALAELAADDLERRRYRLARLYPLMRELRESETGPWTRYDLRECLSEENLPRDDNWDPARQAWVQDPPF